MRVAAYDMDNDPLTYSIDSDDDGDDELFFVDAVTGEIYFRHPWTERRRSYEFQVYADDGLHRSDPATVRVHRLDQSPPDDDLVLVEQSRRSSSRHCLVTICGFRAVQHDSLPPRDRTSTIHFAVYLSKLGMDFVI